MLNALSLHIHASSFYVHGYPRLHALALRTHAQVCFIAWLVTRPPSLADAFSGVVRLTVEENATQSALVYGGQKLLVKV